MGKGIRLAALLKSDYGTDEYEGFGDRSGQF
jgi:hypothetical protein